MRLEGRMGHLGSGRAPGRPGEPFRGVRARSPPKMGPFSPQSGILHGILTFLIVFLMYLICIVSVVLMHSDVLYRCVFSHVSSCIALACLVPSWAQWAQYSIHAAVSTFLDTERYKSIHDQSESPPQRLLCMCINTPPFQNSSLSIQAGVIRCIQTAPCGPAVLGTSGLEGPGRLRP